MQRRYRMQTSGHFRFVYRKGKHASGRLIRLHFAKGRRIQAGFSVSRQVGNAVTRNLVKRRLREAFRGFIPGLTSGSYVVTANPDAAQATYQELRTQMEKHLARLEAFKPVP